MAKTIITRGTGITAKAIVQHSGDDMKSLLQQRVKLLNALAKNRNPFDARIAQTEQWAKSVLKRAGLQATGVEDGHDDTPENYAQRFISEIRFIRAFIDRSEAAQAARFALNLGILMGEAGIKFQWEDIALHGKKFTGSKRGLSVLYKAVIAILEREGADVSTDDVLRGLINSGVVRDFKEEILTWTDDHQVEKTTKSKQFDNRVSELRKRIR